MPLPVAQRDLPQGIEVVDVLGNTGKGDSSGLAGAQAAAGKTPD